MESLLIDLTPVLEQIIQILGAGFLALASWAVKKVADKFHLDADDKVREAVLAAVDRAITYGENKARAEVAKAKWAKPETKSLAVSYAANYVISRMPDAVARFNLDEEAVTALITAKLEGAK